VVVGRTLCERIQPFMVQSQIIEQMTDLGFRYVALDLVGFRSGSLDEVLSEAEKQANR
jgi:PP-loop superfamily ATP-utilizing enzyme